MMYTLKGRYAAVTLLLFTLSHGDLLEQTRQRQRYNPAIPPLPWHLTPPWEYIFREIILKSVTPSSLNVDAPYKRPLDISFYGGSIAAYANDDVNVVLSRGNVYRLLNGHWMLCQDGCVDCEPCAPQRDPLFKWILRRVKRLPDSDPARHDLQLTIMPQADDHFHASNPWPNFYVHVTSQGERVPVSITRTQYDNGPDNPLSPGHENSFSEQHRRSKDLWRLMERGLIAGRDGTPQENDRVTERENTTTEGSESPEQRHRFRNMRRHRPRPRPVEEPAEEANRLAPKLILGTDRQGQKHLIHVVPMDNPPATAFPASSLAANHPISSHTTQSNSTNIERDEQTYQRVFRRVFDSLNTHRRSIENFLESPADNVDGHRISPSMDNMEFAGFSWNNRDINHASANFVPLKDTLSSSYVGNEGGMGKYQQNRNVYGYENTKQDVNDYYTGYRDVNQVKILRRSQIDLDLDRERRRMRIKPYSVNSKNISRIDSSISLQNAVNSSDTIPTSSFSNEFFINFGEQIGFNNTFIDKANNSVELSSTTTKRENGQLFNSGRLKSGGANREFEASHHAFRIIATTESPIIRREHETLNRSMTLQITTSKTSADSS